MLGGIYSGQTYLGQTSTILTNSLVPENGIQAQIAQGTRAIIMLFLTVGGTAHNNLQPYIVAYMWSRTA